ncbi:MAG: hypothetical protein LAN64_12015 [Acidobacteriia bacterium]|nr:hypothetical protein [Terriglobia bacterium]
MRYDGILIAVLVATPLAGFVIELLLRRMRLRGYGHIAGDVRAIVKAVHGETDRDSGDLLIRGSMSSSAVLVRFSRSDQRPGLNIQVPAAGNISLFCVPKGYETEAGRTPLPSSDLMFNARFRLSSDHPGVAEMLFCTPTILAEIHQLCRSSGNFLTLEQQRLEFSELLLEEASLSHRVLDCIRRMLTIAAASRQMPGADSERVMLFPRRWNWFRTAYIGGPILLLSSILLLAKLQKPVAVPHPPSAPSGIAQDEASQIPELQHWRLAQLGDFDPDAVAWLQQQGQQAQAAIRGVFAGEDREDSAYVLKRISASPGDPSRLVVFLKGQVRFDANMPEIAIAARITKDRIASIEWRGRRPAGPPDGDGIFIIQRYQDASSSLVLFASGVQLVIGHPKDFHTISLQ